MLRACWLALLVATTLSAVSISAPVAAGELLAFLRRPYTGPTAPATQPSRFVSVPAGHERYYARNEPDYPWLNNGHAVTAYNWGYWRTASVRGLWGRMPTTTTTGASAIGPQINTTSVGCGKGDRESAGQTGRE